VDYIDVISDFLISYLSVLSSVITQVSRKNNCRERKQINV
jgi:hypothetical protein